MIQRMLGTPVAEGNVSSKVSDFLILIVLIAVAATFRLPSLGSPGYGLDELWTAEVSTGRGGVHLHFPVNQIIQAPAIFDPSSAPPWWNVWSHMEATHPPLYYVTLRFWSEAFGDGDENQRLFAVVSSLVALVLLYDVTRLTNGRWIAVWACVLFAVAPLQIDFARKTRNYALVLAVMLAAADALVRIEKLGVSRWRLAGLLFGVLATPLTHYLSVGAVVGLAVYAAIRLKGQTRLLVLSVFGLAAIIFTVVWGPYFYAQRGLFSVDDPGVSFVKDAGPGHLGRVIDLLLLVPAKMLVPRVQLNFTAYALALLYVVPFFLVHRRPGLLLFTLWLVGDVAVLAILDFTRGSLHMGFARYILMAGPAVLVLVPALASIIPNKWVAHALAGAAVILCLCDIRDGYFDPAADPHSIIQTVQPIVDSADVIVFASQGNFDWTRGVQAMMLIRYLHPFPCPILFLNGPVPATLRPALQNAHLLIVFSSAVEPSFFLPQFDQHESAAFPSWGTVTVFTGHH